MKFILLPVMSRTIDGIAPMPQLVHVDNISRIKPVGETCLVYLKEDQEFTYVEVNIKFSDLCERLRSITTKIT